MTPLEAALMGIIQGLTEPLPISSSAHLVIVPALFAGFGSPSVLFDVVLHLGTMTAVVWFLRREAAAIILSFLPGGAARPQAGLPARRLALLIGVATALTGLVGIVFKDRIEALFDSVETTALMLLVTGVLLFFSDRVKSPRRGIQEMTLTDGIVLGLVQAAALIPGISRSGSTIAFGIFRGLTREAAARFSFLISIPAIAGAAVLKAAERPVLVPEELLAMGIGFLAAAASGLAALKSLFWLMSRLGLAPFAYYCWLLGLATLLTRGLAS